MEANLKIKEVMNYFNCSKEMATRIIEASIVNGELNKIENLCKNDWKKEK